MLSTYSTLSVASQGKFLLDVDVSIFQQLVRFLPIEGLYDGNNCFLRSICRLLSLCVKMHGHDRAPTCALTAG